MVKHKPARGRYRIGRAYYDSLEQIYQLVAAGLLVYPARHKTTTK